jgi:hypothetical protein
MIDGFVDIDFWINNLWIYGIPEFCGLLRIGSHNSPAKTAMALTENIYNFMFLEQCISTNI